MVREGGDGGADGGKVSVPWVVVGGVAVVVALGKDVSPRSVRAVCRLKTRS